MFQARPRIIRVEYSNPLHLQPSLVVAGLSAGIVVTENLPHLVVLSRPVVLAPMYFWPDTTELRYLRVLHQMHRFQQSQALLLMEAL